MVLKTENQRKETRLQMREGKGKGELTHLAEDVKNCRLMATITLGPGDSIGKHDHTSDTEIYYILEGEFLVDDNGTPIKVKKGDSVVTGGGAFHSIENISPSPSTFLAVIVNE